MRTDGENRAHVPQGRRCGAVVSAAQQTPQGQATGNPRRRGLPPTLDHAARHRADRLHDDTRRLRRMLTNKRAKILFATITYHAGRWWVSLNVEADDLHPAHQHPLRPEGDPGRRYVGIDRGLSAFLV